jgi:hypothetical protein
MGKLTKKFKNPLKVNGARGHPLGSISIRSTCTQRALSRLGLCTLSGAPEPGPFLQSTTPSANQETMSARYRVVANSKSHTARGEPKKQTTLLNATVRTSFARHHAGIDLDWWHFGYQLHGRLYLRVLLPTQWPYPHVSTTLGNTFAFSANRMQELGQPATELPWRIGT